MSSDTSSTHTTERDCTANVSPTDIQGLPRFESVTRRNSQHSLARSDAARPDRSAAISPNIDNYGTFVIQSIPHR